MRRAILTGFEPFGPYGYNPVQDTANEYNGKTLGDVEVVGLVLPCTYFGAFEVLSVKIDELSPDIVLGSGLASRVRRIRLEAVGRNNMNGVYADADGRKPDNEPLVRGGKMYYPTNSNAVALANSLHGEGIPSEVSVDAEGFICNSLIYLTSRRISEERMPIKFAFFHTPWTDDYLDKVDVGQGKVTIRKSDLRRTIETLIGSIELPYDMNSPV
jgi:pyroglutamyl-peptidase